MTAFVESTYMMPLQATLPNGRVLKITQTELSCHLPIDHGNGWEKRVLRIDLSHPEAAVYRLDNTRLVIQFRGSARVEIAKIKDDTSMEKTV